MSNIEKTLSIIKPDAVERNLVEEIKNIYDKAIEMGADAVVNFKVTAQKSKVDFTGSKKSDYHTGYFPIKSGAVQVNGGKLVGGSFVIDIAGLKVTDAGGGEKLQGHLLSGDFFDIAKLGFGEASFTISSVEYTKADRATIKGDLNLKGIKVIIYNL